jgi:hypothetical protein
MMAKQPKKRGLDVYLLRSLDGGKTWEKVHTLGIECGTMQSTRAVPACFFQTEKIAATSQRKGLETELTLRVSPPSQGEAHARFPTD